MKVMNALQMRLNWWSRRKAFLVKRRNPDLIFNGNEEIECNSQCFGCQLAPVIRIAG